MSRLRGPLGAFAAVFFLIGFGLAGWLLLAQPERAEAQVVEVAEPVVQPLPAAPPKPIGPPPVTDVLQSGTLIVISKATQQMHVFRDGELWSTSPVSTGRRGHSTPAGVFPILQKRVYHRSNLYSNAPMPYMQRLTWSGIAIHAGHLPGYPASHGCIRLPRSFAKTLFDVTRADRTTVVVTNDPVRSGEEAVTLALNTQVPRPALPVPTAPPPVRMAAQPLPGASPAGQTIQLAAAPTAYEAEAHWQQLVAVYPELGGFRKIVIPAVVNARQVYRLRASAPGAHAYCSALRRRGQDCFNVI